MGSLKDRIEGIERDEIVSALRECDWVMARAARKLGISERMIGYKVRKYKIRREEVKEGDDEQPREIVGLVVEADHAGLRIRPHAAGAERVIRDRRHLRRAVVCPVPARRAGARAVGGESASRALARVSRDRGFRRCPSSAL